MPQCWICDRILSPVDEWRCDQCHASLCEEDARAHLRASHCQIYPISEYEKFRRASVRNRLGLWWEGCKLSVSEWWHKRRGG